MQLKYKRRNFNRLKTMDLSCHLFAVNKVQNERLNIFVASRRDRARMVKRFFFASIARRFLYFLKGKAINLMHCFYERMVGTKGQILFIRTGEIILGQRWILTLNDSRCITLIDHFQKDTLHPHCHITFHCRKPPNFRYRTKRWFTTRSFQVEE